MNELTVTLRDVTAKRHNDARLTMNREWCQQDDTQNGRYVIRLSMNGELSGFVLVDEHEFERALKAILS